MIDRTALAAALSRTVTALVDDLRQRAGTVTEISKLVETEWHNAADAGRTDHDLLIWREDLLTQVAVSWVLGCVFVRFCEDNRLTPDPMLSGPDERRRWANEAQVEFFREHREAGERRYLEHVFTRAAETNGMSGVFGAHNPVWRFGPSDDACRALLEVWRATDPETGDLVWDFTDPGWDTRFLGDLYQDLSVHAKKTYALLQTPEFVESFILDRTLDPAIEEFGLNGTGFRMMDPACGSGHFLLGAFKRLAEHHLAHDPAAGRRAAAERALRGVFGVDLNPYAASIARFRLLVAALRFGGITTLAEAPAFTINVAVGDSLLHGPPPGRLRGVLEAGERQAASIRHLYETEDGETVGRFLGQEYHAVVANPPYITPKDPAANRAYRERYTTCYRQYSLAVPFMELLFGLARRGAGNPAGFVGQITANSFMKREFGKKLITDFLTNRVDLTHVIDTGGVYVPAHGTPTVILIGRNRPPIAARVRAVLGMRGEPSTPADPARGKVWSSILNVIDRPGNESYYVSAADIDRTTLAKHPWSLQGGAAPRLSDRIEARANSLLGAKCVDVGRTTHTGEDGAFFFELGRRRSMILHATSTPLVSGGCVRDYALDPHLESVFPYDSKTGTSRQLNKTEIHHFWPLRTILKNRKDYGKTPEQRRLRWFDHSMFFAYRYRTPLSIAFAFVESHNQFVLDRGGKVFKQSAPVIKLSSDTSVDDHLQFLGLLNSSAACFWMKQVFHNKGAGGGLSRAEKWHDFYEFDGTKLKRFPLVDGSVLSWSRSLDQLANEMREWLPAGIARLKTPTDLLLRESDARVSDLRARMVWLQEELDWRCIYLYGITDEDLSFDADRVFMLAKGERAFEIALARRMGDGHTQSSWFERHGSAPTTELPASWPDWYRQRVDQRLDLIESDRFVKLLERPEYKRRWAWDQWEKLSASALCGWLLRRLEEPRFWPRPESRSVAQLAEAAQADGEFVQVAQLFSNSPEVDFVALISRLTQSDSVPYLAALRYKEPGMRKREAWERTWDLQRLEDSGEDVGRIPVPPKYKSSDFCSPVCWKLRGKLDVAKERFISYPGLERSADRTLVLGWAGWDHLQQAQALTALKNQREQSEGWDAGRLAPLLAGLAELTPWLRQWHNDLDPDLGQGLGDYFTDYLERETQRLGLSADALRDWRPPDKPRGRRRKASL